MNWAELFWRDQVKIRQDQRFRCDLKCCTPLLISDLRYRVDLLISNLRSDLRYLTTSETLILPNFDLNRPKPKRSPQFTKGKKTQKDVTSERRILLCQ